MFHMLTCFDLRPETTLESFQAALGRFAKHMQQQGLMQATTPIGRRVKHAIMDTDDERDHEYFFITTFRDRTQCDRAVEYILPTAQQDAAGHQNVYDKVVNPVFICWEDVQAPD